MLQLRPPSNKDDYDWVFIDDPALDIEHDEFEETWERAVDTGDYSEVPVHPGQLPTVFRLRPLAPDEKEFVIDFVSRNGERQGARMVCALALVSIENLTGPNGKPFEVKHFMQGGKRYVTDKCLNVLAQADGLLVSMAYAALRASSLGAQGK